MKESILYEKSKVFALRVIKLHKFLSMEMNEYDISKQVKRSGTSIGANIAESRFAQSNPDFINKLYIAQKEGSETLYWLELLHESEYLDDVQFSSLYNDCTELMKLLTASINTLKSKATTH